MSRTPTISLPSRFRPSTGSDADGRRGLRLPRWPFLALLVGIACCSLGGGNLDDLDAETRTERVRIFLIARDDGGILGRKTACNDSTVPVEVRLPRSMPALGGALEALLGRRGEADDPRSGLYNALHASPLRVNNLVRRGPELRIRLEGYVELGEPCDADRALAQLTETALQFSDVQKVTFFLGDRPLREALRRP
jgi:Sporulation and spore germination